MKTKVQFLDLGKQPITNNFLIKKNPKNEFFYNLKLIFHKSSKLVSLAKFIPPKKMFNEKYAHRASASKTMSLAYSKLAKSIKNRFKPKSILEIGSNDGVFIKHFKKIKNLGVEPCKNLAKITNQAGVKTYDEFWTKKIAKKIVSQNGKVDVIYSANTISHIHNLNETFKAIDYTLHENGVFILEDPSLVEVLKNKSYDQFYDEHAYVFSISALKNITKETSLKMFDIEKLKTHGGSNRIYFKKNSNKKIKVSKVVSDHLIKEKRLGINKIKVYKDFSKEVKNSKKKLIEIFKNLKKNKERIIGYGATYKSSTVLNYCNLDNKYIDYFLDTTPTKIGKFTPGTHIPIFKYKKISDDIRYVFLGAWNFKDEIFKKEKKFIKRGGKFISHVPYPKII